MIIIITRIVQEMKHFNESHIGDSVGRVWIYRLVFDVCVCVCVFVRLRISSPSIKLAASNFAR